MAFRKVAKRDATTRLKGIREIEGWIEDERRGAEANFEANIATLLPAWAEAFGRLANDEDRKVRLELARVHGVIVAAVGKRLVAVLQSVFGPWLCLQCDSASDVAAQATRAFTSGFAVDKRPAVFEFCAVSTLVFCAETLALTAARIVEFEGVTKDVAETRAALRQSGAIKALALFLRALPPGAAATKADEVEAMLTPALWAFAKSPAVELRQGLLMFIGAAQETLPALVRAHLDRVAPIVLGALSEESSTVHRAMWEAMLPLLAAVPSEELWALVPARKVFFPRLWAFLRHSCHGSALLSYRCIMPMVSMLPLAVIGEPMGFYQLLFEALLTGGRALGSVHHEELAACLAAYAEVLDLAIRGAHGLPPGSKGTAEAAAFAGAIFDAHWTSGLLAAYLGAAPGEALARASLAMANAAATVLNGLAAVRLEVALGSVGALQTLAGESRERALLLLLPTALPSAAPVAGAYAECASVLATSLRSDGSLHSIELLTRLAAHYPSPVVVPSDHRAVLMTAYRAAAVKGDDGSPDARDPKMATALVRLLLATGNGLDDWLGLCETACSLHGSALRDLLRAAAASDRTAALMRTTESREVIARLFTNELIGAVEPRESALHLSVLRSACRTRDDRLALAPPIRGTAAELVSSVCSRMWSDWRKRPKGLEAILAQTLFALRVLAALDGIAPTDAPPVALDVLFVATAAPHFGLLDTAVAPPSDEDESAAAGAAAGTAAAGAAAAGAAAAGAAAAGAAAAGTAAVVSGAAASGDGDEAAAADVALEAAVAAAALALWTDCVGRLDAGARDTLLRACAASLRGALDATLVWVPIDSAVRLFSCLLSHAPEPLAAELIAQAAAAAAAATEGSSGSVRHAVVLAGLIAKLGVERVFGLPVGGESADPEPTETATAIASALQFTIRARRLSASVAAASLAAEERGSLLAAGSAVTLRPLLTGARLLVCVNALWAFACEHGGDYASLLGSVLELLWLEPAAMRTVLPVVEQGFLLGPAGPDAWVSGSQAELDARVAAVPLLAHLYGLERFRSQFADRMVAAFVAAGLGSMALGRWAQLLDTALAVETRGLEDAALAVFGVLAAALTGADAQPDGARVVLLRLLGTALAALAAVPLLAVQVRVCLDVASAELAACAAADAQPDRVHAAWRLVARVAAALSGRLAAGGGAAACGVDPAALASVQRAALSGLLQSFSVGTPAGLLDVWGTVLATCMPAVRSMGDAELAGMEARAQGLVLTADVAALRVGQPAASAAVRERMRREREREAAAVESAGDGALGAAPAAAAEGVLSAALLSAALDVGAWEGGAAAALSHLVAWDLLLEHFVDASDTQRRLLGEVRLKAVEREMRLLLDTGFALLEEYVRGGGSVRHALALTAGELSSADGDIEAWAAGRFLRTLDLAPVVVRSWWEQLARETAGRVRRFVARHVTPDMVRAAIAALDTVAELNSGPLSVSGSVASRAVRAVYEKDDIRLELSIALPDAFPLRPVEVAPGGMVRGISQAQWRRVLLSLTTMLGVRLARLPEVILYWHRSVSRRFEGVEECPICYAVLHATNHQLPKMRCATCSHHFHSACLYTWFTTSQQSSCPLCRSPF